MHNTVKITDDLSFLGVNDRRIALFENVFPVERGISYNSYLLKDEKTVLLDTVDRCASVQFLENLKYELADRALDYLIINHMEPDHAATIQEVVEKYPNVKIVCNKKAQVMIKQFFDFDIESRSIIIKEGDTLNTGKHTLTFVMAPMVHWPEAMVTYDITDGILFSADAFGTFGALSGNIFADDVDFEKDWLDDARRYYTNIVGKYGTQVQALLKKATAIDIKMICPLHGPIWRNKISWFIEKYQKWSTCEPEEETVLIIYGSIYGHTENVVAIIANKLASRGVKNIKMYDVSRTHFSNIVAEAFRCSHIIFASSTYNAGIFCNMETILTDLKAHNLQNRKVAIVENGSWAPTASNLMQKFISEMKGMKILEPVITIKSSLKQEELSDVNKLVDEIVNSMDKKQTNNNSMFKINYGLYLLTTNNGRDNGCIVNTVNQITEKPNRISVVVNKSNYTSEILNVGERFNISVLTEDAPFDLFKKFGFVSGRDSDKFEGCNYVTRCSNGILALNKYSNAIITAKIISKTEYETHDLFIAEVEDAKIISDEPSVTYNYYLNRIKPVIRPEKDKVGFICKICGYVYEGTELPQNFICPLCKHGVEDFEPLK